MGEYRRFYEKYSCATEMYLPSMLEHAYNIIIYRSVGTPVHGIKVDDGIKATNKKISECTNVSANIL